jgi:DNA repair photolyase
MITEISAASILRKYKRVDSWFLTRYGMNLYRGCAHNCVYCDGRAESYHVEGDFGHDVGVKVNAVDVLRRELDPARRRTPLTPCFMALGGGVGDPYQVVEEKYGLARRALELFLQRGWPVHIVTKSTLVERDIDLIREIQRARGALVSMSFSSVNDRISALFEPGVPPPSRRLQTLRRLKREGIACGMFLVPVIPFVTDTPEALDESVRAARDAHLDYAAFGGMTLKEGRQKDHFMRVLKKHYPDALTEYDIIYRGDRWGRADAGYYGSLNEALDRIASRYRIPKRIPPRLYAGILRDNDLVAVMLDQLHYLHSLKGRSSPFGYAGYRVSQLKEPLSGMRLELGRIEGVGERTKRVILEILETGRCAELERLLLQ